jgi:hypothetical protein
MKYIMVVISLIALVPLAFAGEAEWRTFTSTKGGFTVLMPGTPTFTATTDHTVVGAVIENLYNLETPAATFSAEYSDLPGVATFFESDDSLYDDAKEGMLKRTGGKLTSYFGIGQAGIKGKEVECEIPADGKLPARRLRARFLLKDKRLYVISITIPGGKKDDPLFARYLDSFRLLKSD